MLDDKTVKEYLAELGYASVKSFQLAVMYPKYVDGKYGQQTENALISAINVKRNTKNFSVKEFRCECGGRYCCGYPSTLKVEMLRNIQAIRDHYGRPITVTCGLRDKTYNSKLGGSIQNSLHLSGRAVDFYQQGVTDTLANRKRSIKWIKTLPNHHYTYGNGINSYGNGVSAPYMGNALHTDVYVKVSPYDPSGKLICDGEGGSATIKEMQRFFGTPKDGVISGQRKDLKKYYPSLDVEYGKGGSVCIKHLQKWVGVAQDGIIGQGTVKAWQKKIGVTADGIFGKKSMATWQKYLNTHDKAQYPKMPVKTEKPAPSTTITSTQNKIVAKAKSLVGSSSKATSAYKSALNKAYPKRSSWGKSARLGKSCDVFVGTVIRSLGIDKDYPRGLAEQFLYKPKGFTRTVYKNVTPYSVSKDGDVIIYSKNKVPTKSNRKSCKGHTCIRGNGVIYEANYPSKYPHTNKKVKKKLNVKRPYVVVLRAK